MVVPLDFIRWYVSVWICYFCFFVFDFFCSFLCLLLSFVAKCKLINIFWKLLTYVCPNISKMGRSRPRRARDDCVKVMPWVAAEVVQDPRTLDCWPKTLSLDSQLETSNQGLWECLLVLDVLQNTELRICSRWFRELTAPELPWTAVWSNRQGSYLFCRSLFH